MKAYSKQFQECGRLGNRILESCTYCGHNMYMCLIYGGHCSSIKRREDRFNIDNDAPLPRKKIK